MTDPEHPGPHAAVQAWVKQLLDEGYATTSRRLVDQPATIKATLLGVDPDRYFARCRAERAGEPKPPPRSQDAADIGNC